MMKVCRKSTLFFSFMVFQIVLFCLVIAHALLEQGARIEGLHEKARLVRALGLTDLSLFTDARYTRHPSMADRNTPFQDSPLSLDHFPSGTIVLPPSHLREPR